MILLTVQYEPCELYLNGCTNNDKSLLENIRDESTNEIDILDDSTPVTHLQSTASPAVEKAKSNWPVSVDFSSTIQVNDSTRTIPVQFTATFDLRVTASFDSVGDFQKS
mmetsp:Transcript_20368/g.25074  ORF Transcript_20368/g.25074 Transcript_20368/m.25074 type:complete len:109 (-) Transcript_20368:148-474(-)